MKPIDARELPNAARIDTGLCIIGAGVAGITLARELAGASQDVCLVESGALAVEEATQALYDLQSVGYPVRDNFMARARYFGGSSNIWAGRSMRLDPIDFERRDWVPDSGWPISYEEVASYYPRADRVLELPDAAELEALAQRLSNTDGAAFRDGELRPKVVTWGRKPMRFQKTHLKPLSASRNIKMLFNANVTQLVSNEARMHVESANVVTLNGKRCEIRARQFVLACGGLENARLLLCSDGLGNEHDVVGRYFMEHPRAIFGKVRLTAPFRSSPLLGTPLPDGKVQIGVGLSTEVQRRERLLNSYLTLEPQMSELTQQAYQTSANVVKVLMRKGYAGNRRDVFRANLPEIRELIYLLTPKEVMPHFMYRGYARLKGFSHRFRKIQQLTVINFCEQAPRPESRVTLGERRDALGMPMLVLDWRIGREETASLVRLQRLLGERLKKEGVGDLDEAGLESIEPRYTDASHHMGTTRMSDDPRKGVVNRDSRLHDVDNLYVAGSSVFPTVGCANPTLTIVALALRLADRLKRTA